ncbi:MAG TPA: DUF4153 domain-containing protein [Rhizomicrobium sp.]|jgi:hypothetical protein|nr:DUF4153 domain-containing protein [Rhizomicrobium sp.]
MSSEAISVETVVLPPPDPARPDASALAFSRLLVGAGQGIALYLLYLAGDNHAWPSTDPYWMAPLLMVFVFVPLLFTQAVGTMRPRTLMLWTVGAAMLLALLAWYDVWRQWEPRGIGSTNGDGAMTFALIAFSVVGLFIAQALIAAGDAEKRYFASYAAYFDAAWKLGVQLALALAFVAVFWGVLWLGAVLFNLINLKFVETVIEKSWFAIPATTLATAAAIHVTDVRSRLVAGIRTVALTLLSWLLPLMTLIAIGFTLSLPFTGLTPLWATREAASLLLVAAATLVILINAAFQDGDPAHNRPLFLRYAEFAAAIVLLPLVLIATYAVWLRVAQYGWTVERIATAATLVVALCYAFGYAAAALLSLAGGGWMRLLARVNIVAAFVVLALLLALFTPLGDPARLAVNSQVARLRAGAVSAQAFDYDYLKSEGGRYGRAALHDLATANFGGNTIAINKLAQAALDGISVTPGRPTKADIARNVTVYPDSRALPRTLMEQDWNKTGGAPACLTQPASVCDAFFADLDGDGNDEVVLVTGNDLYWSGTVLKEGPDKLWKAVASINGRCPGTLDALKKGQATLAPPAVSWRDWVIRGVRIRPEPFNTDLIAPCPG